MEPNCESIPSVFFFFFIKNEVKFSKIEMHHPRIISKIKEILIKGMVEAKTNLRIEKGGLHGIRNELVVTILQSEAILCTMH